MAAVDFDEAAEKEFQWYADINTALGLDKVDEALRLALDSLKKVRKSKDGQGEIAALRASAKANLAKGDVWNAKRNIEDSLKLARQNTDKKAEAAAQHILAKTHLAERKYEAAKRVGQEALDAFRALEDACASAAVLNTMAKVRLAQEETQAALDLVTESITGFRDIKDGPGGPEGQAFATQTLLQIRLAEMKFQDAILIAEDLDEMYINLESANGRGIAYLAMAEVSLAKDEMQSALDMAMTASEYFQQGGNKKKKAAALFVMANAFVTTEQLQEAYKLADAAYRTFHEAHDKRGKADSLNIVAQAMIAFKQYASASSVLTEMAFLYRQIKDRQMEALALQKLSRNQVDMIDTPGQMPAEGWKQDDVEAPVRNAKRAVALYSELGALQSTGHAEALITLSHALVFTGLYVEALGRADQALNVYKTLGICEADALIQTAAVHHAQGKKDMAQKFIDEAIDVAKETGTQEQQVSANRLSETIKKKAKGPTPGGGGLGRCSFTLMFGDIVKVQFHRFESRAITIATPQSSSSVSRALGGKFKPPERHAVVYETRKQLAVTEPQKGMPGYYALGTYGRGGPGAASVPGGAGSAVVDPIEMD